eukprot:9930704-Lingulodinium_polyedra.AAC.1
MFTASNGVLGRPRPKNCGCSGSAAHEKRVKEPFVARKRVTVVALEHSQSTAWRMAYGVWRMAYG